MAGMGQGLESHAAGDSAIADHGYGLARYTLLLRCQRHAHCG